MWIKVEGEKPVEIALEEIKKGVFDVEIDSGLMLEISRGGAGHKGEGYTVTNAVNGYGQNVKDQYAKKRVEFLDDIGDPLNPTVWY